MYMYIHVYMYILKGSGIVMRGVDFSPVENFHVALGGIVPRKVLREGERARERERERERKRKKARERERNRDREKVSA
jgi:hypothetical protein